MLWEASFSLEGSLGAIEGKVVSWATSLVTFATFSATSDYLPSLEGMLARGRALVGLSLSSSASLEAVSSLELKDPEAQMAEGVHTFCFSKGRGGLNPCLVEGLVPHLEAVVSAHLQDLSPKGFLSLYHSHIVSILLNLLIGLLGLLQFLCQDFNLAFGYGELVLGLAELFALNLRFPLCPV